MTIKSRNDEPQARRNWTAPSAFGGTLRIEITNEEILADLRYPVAGSRRRRK